MFTEYKLHNNQTNPVTGETIPVISVSGLKAWMVDFQSLTHAGGIMVMRFDTVALREAQPDHVFCSLLPEGWVGDLILVIDELTKQDEFPIMLEHELGHCVACDTTKESEVHSEAGNLEFTCQLDMEIGADLYASAKYGKAAVAAAIIDWTMAVASFAGYELPERAKVVENLSKTPIIGDRLRSLQ